jgi:hypothetical protein
MKAWVLPIVLLACGAPQTPTPAATSTEAASGPEARDATRDPLDGWTKLGERVLAEDGKRDSIHASADEGRFKSVRFVIKFGKLEIQRVKITFEEGAPLVVTRPIGFGGGVTSRALDFEGDKRVIRQIDFDFGGVRGGRSTQLEIWAR